MTTMSVRAPTRASRLLVLVTASFWISACGTVEPDLSGDPLPASDSLAGGLPAPLLGAIVSDPVFAPSAPSGVDARSAPAAVSELEVVYVSLAPGSTTATDLTISNDSTSFSTTVAILDGGFDPVVVPASVGHALGFGLFYDGIRVGTWSTRVEAFRRPIVVRTNPSRGQRDIPVASSVAVVFSEPMNPATLTPSTLRLLLGGVAVDGAVTLSPDGLSAQFRPASPLAPNTVYDLSVESAARDLDGDSVAVGELVQFTTSPAPTGIPARLEASSGTAQATAAGEALPLPLVTRVVDEWGNAVPSVMVTFTVTLGGGHLGGGLSVTDAFGIASSGVWTLGLEPGLQQVSVQAGSAQMWFSAWAGPGGPTFRGLFVETPYSRDGVIYRADENGGPLVTVGGGAHPAWSPDGQRVAFTRYDSDFRPDIYLMDADGSNVVRRTSVGGDGEGRYPPPFHYQPGFHSATWSPDGDRLAVASDGWYEGEIYVLSVADSLEPTYIASRAARPAWSPDGSMIAFIRLSGDDGNHAVHVMNEDGSDIREVVPSNGFGIGGLTWSPDGQRIAFSRCVLDVGCDVYSVSVDGSALTKLTDGLITSDPSWSPDGTWIAFTWATNYPTAPECDEFVIGGVTYTTCAMPSVIDWAIAVVPAITGGRPFVVGAGADPAWRP